MHQNYQALFAEAGAEVLLGGVDGLRSELATASRLGGEARARGAKVDLDEGQPFDIYTLYVQVTNRAYDRARHLDELYILLLAHAYEFGAGVREDPLPDL
ncbi:hypothetical protein MMAG44476_37403 [Mycolicibacterium mageritense DSM 44476 = CIP 104973]|jgi:hypothetical protein|uniref:Two-component system sensor kinase n=2 Tax=Mycolicibacterium TaxID=1866885 RepID=A0A100W7L0_MYCCR|nr:MULTISPECIES: hypothetical protein [Mycolicibacterium]MCC9185467.1 hypothetical protein [Mycolicibacterium mageritense]MCV7210774.1 hypothetical protein [Mycolicibacterium canariasense]ORV18615.1 hypothetical protein AWB94_33280 [Mycolicibacterium canariasense]CDO25765.1 hypothetical protein BN978_06283 [Mycolicibacterium mageritense DSM 44476 = CIP 104973]BBX37570.1 hypothetical protein MMAGJ_68520 [Mycolicibacterium mageritense]